MFSVSITKDTSQWDKMEKRLLRGNERVVRVGWWQTQHPTGVPTAQVAAWNEEGHMNGGMFAGTYTPPRPFVRMGFIPSSKKLIPKYFPLIHRIAMGTYTWSQLNLLMAKEMVTLMQETILKWDSPPNTRATVEIKGFNDPLIDTGNMYDAVKYRIVRASEK